ncbi:unnamed protein product [Allacma fusca]|uniref:glutathione transferase n=1 Tax=Allacma fusca TaxID=39272 RepID=A0A8J2L4R9_9HEXA|nr:unnamed protein product [Allacma fusca]
MLKKEFEPWRKSFILQLYESTKDAVEVARRNYLEGRLANGLQREMLEMRKKYENFCKENDNQIFSEKLADFRNLEEEMDAAIVQLKERSDAFVAISSSGWPKKVEYLTYDEILRIQLPNYTRFLFDPNIISFGPISEKWEMLKASFSKEFMNLLDMSPRLSMGRSYSLLSAASSMAFSISEAGVAEVEDSPEDVRDGDDQDEEDCPDDAQKDPSMDDENNPDEAKEGDDKDEEEAKIPNSGDAEEVPFLPPKTTDFKKGIKEGAQSTSGGTNAGSLNPKVKPQVMKRKPNSFKRTLSGAWSQILNSAAQSAESKRVAIRGSDRKTGCVTSFTLCSSSTCHKPGKLKALSAVNQQAGSISLAFKTFKSSNRKIQQSSKMAPQYKLTYFNARAVAEPIRLLLAHANVEYEDKRIEGTEWAELKSKTAWGKLPYLEEGDFQLSQSLAILKYLGNKYGYVGDNIQETARIDELIGAFNDFRDVYFAFRREEDVEKKAEKEKKLKDEAIPFYLERLNSTLEKNGKYFVGNKISIIDFYVAAHAQTMDQMLGGILDGHPALKAHQTTVLEAPGVKEWVEKRPVTQY